MFFIFLILFTAVSSFASEFAPIFEIRTWTAKGGDSISAVLEKVSCDGRYVWIINQANLKSLKCEVALLSSNDRKYVKDSIDLLNALGSQKDNGV